MMFVVLLIALALIGMVNGGMIPEEGRKYTSINETDQITTIIPGSTDDGAVNGQSCSNDTLACTAIVETTTKPTPITCFCGQKKVDTKIINGQQTEVLEYPWQVGIVSTYGRRTWCGGSLINSNWVMSAAHCTNYGSRNRIQIIVAEHDVTVSEDHEERFNVKQIINHPNYTRNPWTNGHDISLIELDGRVNFKTSRARPICLPTGNSSYVGTIATVTGFGRTGYDQPQSDYLQEVDINVTSIATCNNTYGPFPNDYKTMICAGESDGTGGCMGDSGGPLIVKENNHYVQIGIVSVGSRRCNAYNIFTKVTDFRDWITNHTNTGNPDTCSPA